MFSCCNPGCGCRRTCHCSCDCDCGCGGTGGGTTTPETPVVPALSQFPVYVSYPAFFTGDSAITGANQSIFVQPFNARSFWL